MKKAALTVIAIALVALVGAVAWAQGPYGGGGYGRHMWGGGPHMYGYGNGPNAGNSEAAAKFATATLKQRQELAAKRIELQTLLAQPEVDQAKAKALNASIIDLQSQLAKQASETGVARGYGRGGGPGYGRGGNGPGYCWR